MTNPSSNPYFMTPNQRQQIQNYQAGIAIAGTLAAQRAAEDRAQWIKNNPGVPYPPDVTPTPRWLKILGWILVLYVGGSCLLIFIAFVLVWGYQMTTGQPFTPTAPPLPQGP